MSEAVLLSVDGPVARLTLNRPEVLNALDEAMCADLTAAVRGLERRDDVRCLIFSGAGKHFSAGGDLAALVPALEDPAADLAALFETNVVRMSNEFLHALVRLPFPVIASVRGAVTGGGFGFASAADFIVASDSAYFLAAHIRVGLSPDGGLSWFLPRVLGPRLARQVLMLADRMSADEALRVGLVHEVVPDAALEAATDALAARLVAMPAQAIANIKVLVDAAGQHSMADQLQMEARLMGLAARSPDFREGLTAFAEKRAPRFGQGQ